MWDGMGQDTVQLTQSPSPTSHSGETKKQLHKAKQIQCKQLCDLGWMGP